MSAFSNFLSAIEELSDSDAPDSEKLLKAQEALSSAMLDQNSGKSGEDDDDDKKQDDADDKKQDGDKKPTEKEDDKDVTPAFGS